MMILLALSLAVLRLGPIVALEEVQEPSPPAYAIALTEAWIPMPDGVRLAADLYLPSGGGRDERFPVLLEHLSAYRKIESRSRNYALYSYFVRRGYAVARVDIRGTGQSEGKLIAYEYTDQEQADGDVVIAWLSRQALGTRPWPGKAPGGWFAPPNPSAPGSSTGTTRRSGAPCGRPPHITSDAPGLFTKKLASFLIPWVAACTQNAWTMASLESGRRLGA